MSGFRAPPAAPPRAPPPAFDDSSDDDSSEDTDTFTSGKPSTGKSAMPAFTPSRVSIGDGGQGMDQMDQMLNDKKIALAEQKRLQMEKLKARTSTRMSVQARTEGFNRENLSPAAQKGHQALKNVAVGIKAFGNAGQPNSPVAPEFGVIRGVVKSPPRAALSDSDDMSSDEDDDDIPQARSNRGQGSGAGGGGLSAPPSRPPQFPASPTNETDEEDDSDDSEDSEFESSASGSVNDRSPAKVGFVVASPGPAHQQSPGKRPGTVPGKSGVSAEAIAKAAAILQRHATNVLSEQRSGTPRQSPSPSGTKIGIGGAGLGGRSIMSSGSGNGSAVSATLMTNGTEMTVSQYFANVSGDNRGPLFNPVPTSVIPEMFVARPAPSPAPGQMAGAEIDPASGAGGEAGAGHQSVGYESLKCYIRRKKTGTFIKANKYEMFLEQGNRFLMSASKSSKASKSSNYIISADPNGAQRDGPDFLGKLRSNFVGTQFVLYDDGLNPKKVIAGSGRQVRVRREHAAVIYATNVMGTKGPRKMAVHVPKTHPDGSVEPFQPRTDAFSDPGSLVMQGDELCNRPPRWMGGEVGAYVLNFEGRVTMASVKNFQLIRKTDLPAELSGQKRNNGNVLLQFGRVGKDRFNVDIRYPMTPFQAFGIILSSFDGKMACE